MYDLVPGGRFFVYYEYSPQTAQECPGMFPPRAQVMNG